MTAHRLAAAFVVTCVALGAALSLGAARPNPRARALPFYDDVSLTPRWPATPGERDSAHRIGDFHLVDAAGQPVTQRDVEGRVYVASFFYTQCRTLCPDLRAQLARVHEAFAGDGGVMILSHSVMPEADLPSRLAHYAVRNGVDGRQWKLLTGTRAELVRLARDAYFVELADTSGNTAGRLRHTETLVLVDPDGHIRGVYDGSLAFDVTQLIADIRQLKS